MRVRVLVFLNEFHVEASDHVRCDDQQISLGKCLTKARTFTSIEGHPAHWLALRAIWRQIEWTCAVESIRVELVWFLPLITVLVKAMNLHEDLFTGADFETLDSRVFRE